MQNATPAPFYNCAPACAQDHNRNIYIQQFSADVKLLDSWNVPACNATATINTEALKAIVVGSYIWNPAYGYFKITAFNSGTGQVTIENLCTSGNAAAGTNVPACTEFTVTVPPCSCGDIGQPCVAIDFTAPEENVPLDITLTATTGLQTGDTVQIGSGFYFLAAIKPNDVVTIINKGDGITPGTSVIAKDSSGNYQYCLSIISDNACSRDADQSGTLQVCGANESNDHLVTVPLQSQTVGWVATAIDATTGDVAMRPTGIEAECANLEQTLNVVMGTASYTNVTVSSSSEFVQGDVIEFDGFGFDGSTPRRFTITNIPDSSHITGTFTPTPSASITIGIGTLFCLQSCCETLTTQINTLSASFASNSNSTSLSEDTPVIIKTATPTHDTATLTWNVLNASPTKVARVLTIMKFDASGTVSSVTGNTYLTMDYSLTFTVNGGGPNTVTQSYGTYLAGSDDEFLQSMDIIHHRTDIIPAGATWTFTLKGNLTWTGVTGDSQYETNDITINQSFLAESVAT